MRPLAASVLAFFITASQLPSQVAETQAAPVTVDDAIDRGIAWLLAAQKPDGSWSGPEPDLYRGMTALAAYTLIKCGRTADHPAVRAAVASVRSWPIERTYDVGCALMLFHALGESRPKDAVKPLAERLLATISNGKRLRGARWGYPNDREGVDDAHTDLSNTQYAVLGLRAARLAGYKAGSPLFWESVARDVLEEQSPYGGFGYKHGEKPSASMTVAGLTILVICVEALGASIELNLAQKIKGGIERGLRWLDDDWAVDHMIDLRLKERTNDRWLDYYLYGLERLGAITEKEAIGRHRWYEEGSAQLLKSRKADGHWGGGDSDTAFALLFLRRGSRVSGLSERRKREERSAADSAILVAMDGENPVRAWVRGAGEALRAKLAEGAAIRRFEWILDGGPVSSVATPSVDALATEPCALKYAIETNGPHRIIARVSLAGPDGKDGDTLESNALVLEVDNAEEAWHREAARDARKNALIGLGGRVTATASSSLDAARAPAFAIDGQYGTHWLSGRSDLDPAIQIVIQGGTRGSLLKLGSAGPFGEHGDYYGRPRDIEVAVNGGEPIAVRLEDTIRRKQSIRLPAASVRSLQVRIRSVYPGKGEPNVSGFSEIELHDLDPDGLADLLMPSLRAEAVLPPARSEPSRWRYVFEAPSGEWTKPGFPESGWKEGEAGFGTKVATYAPIRTPWKSREIWVRRAFTFPKDGAGELRIEIDHDDDAEVWINGVLAAEAPKSSGGGYLSLAVSEEARATIHPGQNLIAAHCTDTGGVSYLDVALVRLLPLKPLAGGK